MSDETPQSPFFFAKRWEEFQKEVLFDEADPNKIRIAKITFYSGANATLEFALANGWEPSDKIIEDIITELLRMQAEGLS